MPHLQKIHRTCPLCGSYDADVVYHRKESFLYFDKLPQEFNIVACKVCGFIYSDIAASQQIYDEYYSTCSAYENLGVTYGKVLDDHSREVYVQRATEIAQFVSKDDSILEIGSANGFLLEELRKLGLKDLNALDLSLKSLTGLKERGFQTYFGGIFSAETVANQFDCICLTQVMEHIYDIQGAIQNIKRMLKPGGVLYIEVPDVEHYKDFPSQPFSFFHFEHIGYFDEVSLRNLAEGNGMVVKTIIHKSVRFSTNQNTYPCVAGIFEKRYPEKSNSNAAITDYIQLSERQIEQYVNLIENLKQEIVLWGIGTLAKELLKRVNEKWNIRYLVDSNPLYQNTYIGSLKIYTPQKLLENHFSGTILITTVLYSDEVVDQIKEMRLNCNYKKLTEP